MDNEDDQDLWDFVTKDAKPIERQKPLGDEENPVPKTFKEVKQSVYRERGPNVVVKNTPEAGVGLDHKTAEKLRKGQMLIEGRLDLHGMTQIQAREALEGFILRAQLGGKRCVLVITGKGAGVNGRRDPLSPGQGVLKQNVPLWLEEGLLRPVVLKCVKARPRDGGEGALYVLLRRQR